MAVLLEEGLRNGSIVLPRPRGLNERPEPETSQMMLALGAAFAFLIGVPVVAFNYHRLADVLAKIFERHV